MGRTRKKLTLEERQKLAEVTNQTGCGRETRGTLLKQINECTARGASRADVDMMWFRLMLKAPDIWGPRWELWVRSNARIKETEQKTPEPVSGFDQ
jgi:hypothetical protein